MKILELFKSYNPYKNQLNKPYVIAEAGVNHEGNIELAKRLIDEAVEGGAQAIKFQAYKAEKIATKNSPAYWDRTKEAAESQFKLFQRYDKFWKREFEELKHHCIRNDIDFLCTPFDIESATILNELVDVFKISSSDISNIPFIEYICKFRKPIILSTGASHIWEIQEAIEIIDSHNIKNCIMHCILSYPTKNDDANLGMLIDLKQKFPNSILGYSDHTTPQNMEVLAIANLLGAVILEKHFTYDKKLPGNDHYHAMDKEDLKLFFKKIEKYYTLIGSLKKTVIDSEGISRQYARRSLVAFRSIKAGEIINEHDLTWKRPGTGICPKYLDQLIGKTALVDIHEDEIIEWNIMK